MNRTAMTDPAQPDRNDLLAALMPEIKERIFPLLKRVELQLGEVIYEAAEPITEVYFPVDCIISLLYVTADGESAEICVVGHEGLVGTAVILGGQSTPSRAVVQSAGSAFALPARELKAEFDQHPGLRALMLRYMQALIIQMSQTAVCNRHHSIEQQLCRWLLLSLDRLSGNQVHMTQELIANMLGVRREGVTEAAHRLKEIGVIDYRRGHIRVLDRPRLEQLCCECYAVVKAETDRLYHQTRPD